MSLSERRKPSTASGEKSKRHSDSSRCLHDETAFHEDEIQKMTARIQELKQRRQLLHPMNKYNEMGKTKCDSSSVSSSSSVKTGRSSQSSSKRRLYHPNLDSVFVGVAHSPYLTDPSDVYTKDTIRTSNALRQLNQTGKELKRISDLPFDLKKSKETFLESLSYAPSFKNVPIKKTKSASPTSITSSSPSQSIISSRKSVKKDNSFPLPEVGGEMDDKHRNLNLTPKRQKSTKKMKHKSTGIGCEVESSVIYKNVAECDDSLDIINMASSSKLQCEDEDALHDFENFQEGDKEKSKITCDTEANRSPWRKDEEKRVILEEEAAAIQDGFV